jgi:hypothetical protein
MREEAIFIPAEVKVYNSCTLSRKIPAIRLEIRTGSSGATAKLGSILQLPAGSWVEVCGDGFNPRTVKVRHHDSFYFVFQEDLAG